MVFKNVVFDVGNVLVRWDPQKIVQLAFPEADNPSQLVQDIFRHATWYDLNLGIINEQEAIDSYHKRLKIDLKQLQRMAEIVRESLTPLSGSVALLKSLHAAQYNLYALTDNTHEIMAHLKQTYDFWPLFQGIVVSAEVGFLKPNKEIYHHLLKTYQLHAHETVFIDDHLPNIVGAKALGIKAIQFENSAQCIEALRQLQIRV